jgi:hypothetical protein
MKESEIDEIVKEVFQEVTDDFANFVEDSIPDGRSLFQTVALFPINAFNYQLQADLYFKYVNEGVEGVGGDTAKRQVFKGSRFKFKKYKVGEIERVVVTRKMHKAIKEWRGFDDQTAYKIAMSIKVHGIEKKDLTTKFFTPEKLEQISALLLEKLRIPLTLSFNLK